MIMISCFLLGSLSAQHQGQINIIQLNPRQTLGTTSESRFLNAQDLTICSDGSVVVSDKLDYKLVRFDARGRKTGKTGKRGNNPGEFHGPAAVASHGDIIAVADFASHRIHLYSTHLEYRKTIVVPGAILDLRFDSRGELWVGLLQDRPIDNLIRISLDGKIQQTIKFNSATSDPFDNMFMFTISPSNRIVVLFSFRNKIEIWGIDGTFIDSFEVAGFPGKPGKKRISSEMFSEGLLVPEDNLFAGIAVDKHEAIYVLAGEYSHSPRQDVFGVDRAGNLVSLAVLPEPSSLIEIGPDNRLYSIERNRTRVTVYRMEP